MIFKNKILISLILLSFCKIIKSESKINNLVKAFAHMGLFEDKIVLYFKNDPIIKFYPKKCQDTQSMETFFLPGAKITGEEGKAMIAKINAGKHPFYKVSIKEMNMSGQDGVCLKIIYNPKSVNKLEILSFNAISSFKGIAINILHKDAKYKLNNVSNLISDNIDYKKPNIILDFGHGGIDSGAVGVNDIKEKDITYCVGMKLKKLLVKNGFNVFLTRDSDKFIALDERTTMANVLPVEAVFISIHANHSTNSSAEGLETYYAEGTLLNKHFFKNDILTICPNIKSARDEKNRILALHVHKNIFDESKKHNPSIIDRKVKRSVSQVLLGTEMPAILIELGFISNLKEGELLDSPKYQNAQALGIFNGVTEYYESI